MDDEREVNSDYATAATGSDIDNASEMMEVSWVDLSWPESGDESIVGRIDDAPSAAADVIVERLVETPPPDSDSSVQVISESECEGYFTLNEDTVVLNESTSLLLSSSRDDSSTENLTAMEFDAPLTPPNTPARMPIELASVREIVARPLLEIASHRLPEERRTSTLLTTPNLVLFGFIAGFAAIVLGALYGTLPSAPPTNSQLGALLRQLHAAELENHELRQEIIRVRAQLNLEKRMCEPKDAPNPSRSYEFGKYVWTGEGEDARPIKRPKVDSQDPCAGVEDDLFGAFASIKCEKNRHKAARRARKTPTLVKEEPIINQTDSKSVDEMKANTSRDRHGHKSQKNDRRKSGYVTAKGKRDKFAEWNVKMDVDDEKVAAAAVKHQTQKKRKEASVPFDPEWQTKMMRHREKERTRRQVDANSSVNWYLRRGSIRENSRHPSEQSPPFESEA